jgi:hypothetical protein
VGDLALGVEDRMGQDNAVGADLNAPATILVDTDKFANEATGQFVNLQL